MATNIITRAEHEVSNSEKEEEEDGASTTEDDEEEEALSLCDLPDNDSNKEDDQATGRKADSSQAEEFDFLLWGGPFSKESSQMCVADEVFFQGQILPLCSKSFHGSDPLLPTGFNRSESSRSESVTSDFRSSTSSSSRSSSIRSQNSNSSSLSTNPEISKPIRMRNHHHHHHHQFHSHPSPKPQVKSSNSTRQVSFGGHSLSRKSSRWDFFRLGVAPAPEIELQDLKVRCTNNNNKSKNSSLVSRNSSNSSSSDSNSNGFRKMVMRGCKCSIETVPFDVMISKSNNKKTESSTTHAVKEKVKQQKQRRKAMSRHRTFEWIKELSHAESYSYKDDEEEALLSKSLYCNLT